MLQGITLDYDGTIARTSERQYQWFIYWSDENGVDFPFSDVEEFMKFYNERCSSPIGVQKVYDELKLPCDMNDKNHPVWKAYTEYKERNPASFYPGMKEVILELHDIGNLSENYQRNRRLRLAINTTNSWESIYPELKKEGVLGCFDSFVTEEVLRDYHGAMGGNGITKPSKIPLALNLGLIGSNGESVIHVGDTLNDLAASHKVIRLNPSRPETLLTVGAAWGYEGREKLESGVRLTNDATLHFNYIIDKPEELVSIVRKLL